MDTAAPHSYAKLESAKQVQSQSCSTFKQRLPVSELPFSSQQYTSINIEQSATNSRSVSINGLGRKTNKTTQFKSRLSKMHITKALAAMFLGLACSCYALPLKPNDIDATYTAEPRSDSSNATTTTKGRLAPFELEARWIKSKADHDVVEPEPGLNKIPIAL